ncbi:hypothetical protein RZS08_25920, partial [Arthrospira platensis SPKY1]|nr:hypothetical protein [Arthrospira platensis SPKY1]
MAALLVLTAYRPVVDFCGPAARTGFKGYSFMSPDYLPRETSGFPLLLRFDQLYQNFIDSTSIRQVE